MHCQRFRPGVLFRMFRMEAIGDLTETCFFLVVERKQGVWRGVNGICELCASRRGFEGKSGKEMEVFPSFPSLPCLLLRF